MCSAVTVLWPGYRGYNRLAAATQACFSLFDLLNTVRMLVFLQIQKITSRINVLLSSNMGTCDCNKIILGTLGIKLLMLHWSSNTTCPPMLRSTHVQAIRVMSSSRALSRWFPWTSNTSLIAFCWKPISLNWVRRRRNSAAWNGKVINVKGTVHPIIKDALCLWLIVPFLILVWAAQQNKSHLVNVDFCTMWFCDELYLALTVLKHLQSFFHLCFIITQLTQTVAGLQISQDLPTKGQETLK